MEAMKKILDIFEFIGVITIFGALFIGSIIGGTMAACYIISAFSDKF